MKMTTNFLQTAKRKAKLMQKVMEKQILPILMEIHSS